MRDYVEILRAGGVVACPTETQMGLLADALDALAVQRIYELKRRRPSDPLPLIVPSLEAALRLARDVSAQALALAARHWPGPLTLVLHGQSQVPTALLADGKLALRVPGPSPALELVTAFGGPLTATSANRSGQSPLTTELELRAIFGDALAAVVPGTAPGGLPSTIVDATGERLVVLRQGAIALEL
jgi:L-threonylcarbamoyladenylate synthase